MVSLSPLSVSPQVCYLAYASSKLLSRLACVLATVCWLCAVAVVVSGLVFPFTGGASPKPKRLFLIVRVSELVSSTTNEVMSEIVKFKFCVNFPKFKFKFCSNSFSSTHSGRSTQLMEPFSWTILIFFSFLRTTEGWTPSLQLSLH